jgi:hypothetical protein
MPDDGEAGGTERSDRTDSEGRDRLGEARNDREEGDAGARKQSAASISTLCQGVGHINWCDTAQWMIRCL